MYLQENREKIAEGFEKKLSALSDGFAKNIREKISRQEEKIALALKYLYLTSPFSDISNYSFETYLDFAAHGVRLMEQGPYKNEVPEDIFFPYVMHHRVNEEEIEACRSFFYEQIREGIKGLSMKEAILAVNFWCAGEATYQCSDDRTASAMTVYKTARGRCGEESTFTVNAMRSVGIPARQVYAPRWSHCDDNHAWAEVWCDGQWYFIGACEPEAVLNRGWFVGASSRAMLVHSRWFDPMTEPVGETVIEKAGMVRLLNQTDRYAHTKKVTVTVFDTSHNPVKGAYIRAGVLNYSELYPVAEVLSDEKGMVSLNVGKGSIFLEAAHDGSYGVCNLDVDKEQTCTLILQQEGHKKHWGKEDWLEFDFYAPKDDPLHHNSITPMQRAQVKEKSDEMNRHRLAKKDVKNQSQRELFLQRGTSEKEKNLREKLLDILCEKDQIDFKADVLEEHFTFAMEFHDKYPEDIFLSYVANPRIYFEKMDCFREKIKETISEDESARFTKEPSLLAEWLEEKVIHVQAGEYPNLVTVPAGLLASGTGSLLSGKILLVACLRTLGIAARFNPQDHSVEYYREGRFYPVKKQEEKSAVLRLLKKPLETWQYMQNVTLGVWNKKCYETLAIKHLEFVGDGAEVLLRPGDYRLVTTNRLPNGNSFAALKLFSIKSGEKVEIPLFLRSAKIQDMLEEIQLPDFELETDQGEVVKGSRLSKDGASIFFFLEEGKEPTEHILNELIEHKQSFRDCGAKLIFIVRDKECLKQATLEKCRSQVENIQVYFGNFEELIPLLARGMYVDPEKLPLMIVTKGSLKGIYGTCGYNVGTGDMLLKVLS